MHVENPFRAHRENGPRDYRPECDVPSLNDAVSDHLVDAIRRLRGRTEPDPGLKIPVLRAPPGFGKTHLFGRVSHQLRHEVLFIFVPQLESLTKPLDHIRWHVVESLFAVDEWGTPLETALARACLGSFRSWFDWLPESLRNRHRDVIATLSANDQEAVKTVLEIVRANRDVDPFLGFANSLAAHHPDLSRDIVRALALAWSPAKSSVRPWLRGESLPEEQLAELGLPADAPQPIQVLTSLARLFARDMPFVICCDQLEGVLSQGEDAVLRLTTDLTGLLQSVPNQLITVSCLQDRWDEVNSWVDRSFQDRIDVLTLENPTASQATELVRRRIEAWSRSAPDRGATWPIDEGSIHAFFDAKPRSPREVIKVCDDAMQEWIEEEREDWVSIAGSVTPPPPDPTLAFRLAWEKELDRVRREAPDPGNLQEERILRGIEECLLLTEHPSWRGYRGGLQGVLKRGLALPAGEVPILELQLAPDGEPAHVIVAVTKLNNGNQFRTYFSRLEKLLTRPVERILLVHPGSDLKMGAKTREAFDAHLREGTLRTLPLVEHPEVIDSLEVLLSFLDRAFSQELEIGGKLLTQEDVRARLGESGLIGELKLLACAMHPASVEPAVPATASVGSSTSLRGTDDAADVQPSAAMARVEVERQPAPLPRASTDAWATDHLERVVEKLRLWNLRTVARGFCVGPTFVRLELQPQGTTTISRLRNKAEDLKIHLGLETTPFISSQPGHVSIDIQRPDRQVVTLDQAMAMPPEGEALDEPVFPVGLDVGGDTHWLNFADSNRCHLLIGGTTGSGKSEFLKALLATLAFRLPPEKLQFILVDPKQVTFNFGASQSPYLLEPVAYTLDDALPLVGRAFEETERRYTLMRELGLSEISQLPPERALPRIVLVIDEFADLMADKESKKALEAPLKRVGAKARAAGIHLVLATQRPEASVVTPLLRSNLPGRICLKVASEADSKIVLGQPDGHHLLGHGDLLLESGGKLLRLQSPLVSPLELTRHLRMT